MLCVLRRPQLTAPGPASSAASPAAPLSRPPALGGGMRRQLGLRSQSCPPQTHPGLAADVQGPMQTEVCPRLLGI